MKIYYYKKEGEDDLLNVEGGIADALEGVAYKNDKQIWSSSIEQHFVTKDPSWYRIDLEFLNPAIPSSDGEFSKQFEKK